MGELKAFKIRFYNYGILAEAIVIAETIEEAETLLQNDYKEFNLKVDIDEYEEITDKGVALTWYEPLETHSNT
jgi:hypothetical protein